MSRIKVLLIALKFKRKKNAEKFQKTNKKNDYENFGLCKNLAYVQFDLAAGEDEDLQTLEKECEKYPVFENIHLGIEIGLLFKGNTG